MSCYEVTDYLTALVVTERFPNGFVVMPFEHANFIMWCCGTFSTEYPDPVLQSDSRKRNAIDLLKRAGPNASLLYMPTIADVEAWLPRDIGDPRCYGCGKLLTNHWEPHTNVYAYRPTRMGAAGAPQLRGPRAARARGRVTRHRRRLARV